MALALAVSLSLVACDGGDDPDGGADAGTTDAGGGDAGPSDTTPPTVLDTVPDDGAESVPLGTAITVTFSEPMDRMAGAVTIEPGSIRLPASIGRWTDEDQRLIFTGVGGLLEGTEYVGTVGPDFTDRAGNPIEDTAEFRFVTIDLTAPEVRSSTPSEGATDVSSMLSEVTVTFTEPMDPARGMGILSGGRAILGEPSWNVDDTEVTWPVTGVEAESVYALSLEGFTDDSGNALDTVAYLDDGFLDFRTGADTQPPSVVVSDPPEAGSGVDAFRRRMTVTFSEPMSPFVVGATLSDGTTDTDLTGSWNDDFTILTFDVGGLLAFDQSYSVTLSGFGYEDLEGNALDETTYLGDGAIDFDTGPEDPGPVALASDPIEGGTGVSPRLTPLTVRFNEPMDTSITDADLSNARIVVTLTGGWDASGTILRFDVPTDLLENANDYDLDLRAFEDVDGNALNATHPYLDDGILDFRTADPDGENCSRPLTVAQADMRGGRLSWLVPEERRRVDGGTASCDPDSSGSGQDFVIEYEKTSADLAGGGSLLHVFVSSGDDLNIEVRQGTCAPGDDADQLACNHDFGERDVYLDVGPGTYYIWVAGDSTSDFGATVEVEELGDWPEGESCAAPYTTASSIHTGGGGIGMANIWEIPPTAVTSYDRAPSTSEGLTSCNGDPLGVDTVVAFDKTSDDSVLLVRVAATDDSFSVSDLDIEISDTCDPTASPRSVYACQTNEDDPYEALVGGPAGTRYIWLANTDTDDPFPGATVEVTEIAAAEGESCNTARMIGATGDTTLSLDSTQALGTPSCFGGGGNVTWYRFAPSGNLVSLQTDVAGDLAVIDRGANEELSCVSDASASPLFQFVPTGTEVCIGLSNDASYATLSVGERSYTGVGSTVTDLNVERAVTSSGSEISWTSDEWMTVTPTTVYLAEDGDLFQFPKTGGTRAVEVDGPTATLMGECGVSVGEQVFSMDDAGDDDEPAWSRLWDGVTYPWAPEDWDQSPFPYNFLDMEACNVDGSSILYTGDESSGPTDIYTLPSTAAATPTSVGSIPDLSNAVGIAADSTYYYVAAENEATSGEGIYRVPRGSLTDTPVLLADITVPCCDHVPMFIDDPASPSYLYFRDSGELHVVIDPAGTDPLYIGAVNRLGTSSDYAMTYDRDANAIYIFETETDSTGRIVRIEP
ncbi:MAG TPA: Ig-like domain-containing protein [Sandaracinaceae bacterium LLY-WYZ-13_1]|nr:Ig-like domain-containing protein [Sandaracinaceae bacterium LLY-WYZ-13_1]